MKNLEKNDKIKLKKTKNKQKYFICLYFDKKVNY